LTFQPERRHDFRLRKSWKRPWIHRPPVSCQPPRCRRTWKERDVRSEWSWIQVQLPSPTPPSPVQVLWAVANRTRSMSMGAHLVLMYFNSVLFCFFFSSVISSFSTRRRSSGPEPRLKVGGETPAAARPLFIHLHLSLYTPDPCGWSVSVKIRVALVRIKIRALSHHSQFNSTP